MDLRNESIGGAGYASGGMGLGGLGGGGTLLGVLIGTFLSRFNRGDFDGAKECCCQIQAQLGDIRHELGDVKFDQVNATLNQTIGLLGEINNGRIEHLQSVFGLSKQLCAEIRGVEKDIHQVDRDVLENRHILDKDIVVMGMKNDLNNANQTAFISEKFGQMQHFADQCCCKTNANIERTAFETQLRDLQNKCDTDKQLAEIKCLITTTATNQELERLKRAELQAFIVQQTNRGVNTTIGHWSADAQFNGVTYPQPPVTYTGSY